MIYSVHREQIKTELLFLEWTTLDSGDTNRILMINDWMHSGKELSENTGILSCLKL